MPPEDHFRKYAAHGYVQPLPFDKASQQYGSMLPKHDDIFEAFQKFREKRVKQTDERSVNSVNTPRRNRLEDFLHNHVKNAGGEQKKKWMYEFSSNKDLSELLDNVPLHSHKPKGSNSPLLDQLSEYQPPLSRASWYVKVIFLYAELKQPKRKNAKDVLRKARSTAWTTQVPSSFGFVLLAVVSIVLPAAVCFPVDRVFDHENPQNGGKGRSRMETLPRADKTKQNQRECKRERDCSNGGL